MCIEMKATICKCLVKGDVPVESDLEFMDLSNLRDGEYYTICIQMKNARGTSVTLHGVSVLVDRMGPWGWADFDVKPGKTVNCRIYHDNAQKFMSVGTHVVTWRIGNHDVGSREFVVSRGAAWPKRLPFPHTEEIRAYNVVSKMRSPYLSVRYDIPISENIVELSAEFKSDMAPNGSYFCIAQWDMGLQHYKGQGINAFKYFPSVGGYCGLQVLGDGTRVSIFSLWDTYLDLSPRKRQTIRASLLYSCGDSLEDTFTGEGDGVHCRLPYDWVDGRWYRMAVRCVPSKGAHTLLEQWVTDMSTGVDTLLCTYDTCLIDSLMKGPVYSFSENFDISHAGELRAMEVRNVSCVTASSSNGTRLDVATIHSRAGEPDYSGSYSFGDSDGTFWMVASGVGGDWFANGKGQAEGRYKLT